MIRKIVSITILVSFISWSAWYVYWNTEDFLPITKVAEAHLLMLTAAFAVILICNGVFIFVVTSAFKLRLKSIEWLSLSVASSFANYFLPFKGGVGLRAIYMSKLHGFPITDFISTLSVMYLMHIVINGVLALTGIVLIKASGGPVDTEVFFFFSMTAVFGVLLVSVRLSSDVEHLSFPLAHLSKVVAAYSRIRQDRLLSAKLWLLMLFVTIITVLQCMVAFDAIAIQLSWGGVFLYTASKNLAMLVSLTPGSLGIAEVISIYLGNILGYSTAEALLVQGLIRSVAITVLLLSGPMSFLLLKRYMNLSKREF